MGRKHPVDESQVFTNALQHASPAARAAYLDAACAGNPQLRADVEALLRAHADDPDFLERPAAAVQGTVEFMAAEEPKPAGGGEQPGMVLAGRYKLLQQIGEGGMGTVWMAQQTEPVKRLVALKLIKAGMDSQQVIARFEAERQALALVDHANIARVLDGGTTGTGRPYFVMDLVKGVPITRYCDTHHLTPRQRLELFVPVCQAVQHAHQKGIIHRDLKPSNVLVALYDGKPVPKVIDFGVAKAAGQSLTDKTLVTGFGNIVGTLEYMSPEQAEINQLDIDTRSDIYSLGVLLYELLTGSPPFTKKDLEKAGMLEMLRVIREQEPSKPSTKLSTAEGLPTLAANRGTEPAKLTKLVRGELDWIVMKALEKDRSRRYETANGFAMDVQRYLADEPVQACPPSVAYRLRKFTRRNKATLTAAALVLLALLLGTIVSTWQAVRATRARDAERASHDALDAAREQQDRQRTSINGKLSRALADVASLREKSKNARPSDNAPWNQLREALRGAEALAGAELADPALVGQVRALQAGVKQEDADRHMVARLEEIRLDVNTLMEGGGVRGNPRMRIPACEAAFRDYGVPLFKLDVEEVARRIAASAIRDALVAALEECFFSCGDEGVYRVLPIVRRVKKDPWHRQYYDALALGEGRFRGPALLRLVNQPETLAQPPATLGMFGWQLLGAAGFAPAVELLREAQRRYPADLWINRDLAGFLYSMSHEASSRHEAVRLKEESLGFFRVALAARPESPALRATMNFHLSDTNSAYGKLGQEDSSAYLQLAETLRARGDLEGAIVAYRNAIDLDPKNYSAYRGLGNALLHEKDDPSKEDVAAVRKALELYPRMPGAHYCLGRALQEGKGDRDGAIAAFRKTTELDPNDWEGHWALAEAVRAKGDLEAAIVAYHKAIEKGPGIAGFWWGRAEAYRGLRQWDKAAADYSKYVELQPKAPAPLNELARLLATCPEAKLRDPARAVRLARKAVEMSPQDGNFWNTLGVAQYRAGNWQAAIDSLTKAEALHQGGDPVDFFFLAMAHRQLGHQEQSRKRYDQAVQWQENKCKALEKDPQRGEELRRFRSEAEEVLELKKK
jgi:serine/threonine protein kinase/Flp pilus assembly protein TadD